jgi:hypothetical protein
MIGFKYDLKPGKQELLTDLSRSKPTLVGILGRHAFHIYNKTDRTWMCHIDALGYQALAKV